MKKIIPMFVLSFLMLLFSFNLVFAQVVEAVNEPKHACNLRIENDNIDIKGGKFGTSELSHSYFAQLKFTPSGYGQGTYSILIDSVEVDSGDCEAGHTISYTYVQPFLSSENISYLAECIVTQQGCRPQGGCVVVIKGRAVRGG